MTTLLQTTSNRTHSGARWDWYSASLDVDMPDVVDHLQVAWACSAFLRPGSKGYARGVELRKGDHRLAVVLGGGHNPGSHVEASSAAAEGLAATLRGVWPDHRVARADAAYDFAGGREAWAEVSGVMSGLASDRRVMQRWASERDAGSPVTRRTHYLGSPKAEVVARLYEKGLKDYADSRPDLVRLEVQVRPHHRERKQAVAGMTPAEVSAYTPWSRELVARTFGEDIDPELVPRVQRRGDDERALEAMVEQYGRVMARQAWRVGGWEDLGVLLGEAVAARWPVESAVGDVDVSANVAVSG